MALEDNLLNLKRLVQELSSGLNRDSFHTSIAALSQQRGSPFSPGTLRPVPLPKEALNPLTPGVTLLIRMTLKQALINLHESFVQAKISHGLIGGFALAVHGVNRATGDIDFLVDEIHRQSLTECMKGLGFSIFHETLEVIHFEGPVRVEVLFARRPISREMLARASMTVTATLQVPCLQVEDIIGLKIQAYCNNRKREFQDKADIQKLLETHLKVDAQRIKDYAEQFGEWDMIRKLFP